MRAPYTAEAWALEWQAVETAEYMRKRAAELAAAQQPSGGVAAAAAAAASVAPAVSWPTAEPQRAPSWPAQVKHSHWGMNAPSVRVILVLRVQGASRSQCGGRSLLL